MDIFRYYKAVIHSLSIHMSSSENRESSDILSSFFFKPESYVFFLQKDSESF